MTELLIRGVGAPIGVAVITLLILTQPWRKASRKERAWAAGIAASAAFLTGFVALFGWPKLPPPESWQWLPLIAAAVSILAIPLDGKGIGRPLQLAVMLAVAVISAWMILPHFVTQHRYIWFFALAAAIFTDWLMMRIGARRLHAAFSVSVMMIFATAASILLARHAGNAKLGQLTGAIAAPLGVCMIVAIWRKPAINAAAVAAPVALTHVGLIASAFFNHYSQTPNLSFALVAAAPLTFAVPVIPGVGKLKPVPRALVVLVSCIALLTIGLALAEKAYVVDDYTY